MTGGWVDLERGVLFRRGTAQRETRKRQPPSKLPRRLLPHLRRWHRVDGGRGHIVNWDGEAIKKERRAWERARIAAGLEGDVTPHVLRHTCTTWLVNRGIPIFEVAQFVGMSPKTLERVYGHLHPDFQANAASAL